LRERTVNERKRWRVPALAMAVAMSITACGGADDGDADPTTDEPTAAEADEGDEGDETEEPAPEPPADPVTLEIMMYPGQTYRLPLFIAEQEGYLAEAGIEIEEVPQPANLSGVQGLEATGADIAILATATLAQGWQAGADVDFFCGSIPILQTTLMAAPDSDLPSTADGASWEEVLEGLSGTTIGIQTPIGSGLHLIFESVLETYGVTDVTFVNTGVQANLVEAALANGDVDVAQASPSTTQALEVSGAAEPILYMPDGPEEYQTLYGSGWVAPRAWVEENPELATGFCDALDRALDFINDDANAEATEALLQEDLGIEGEVATMVRGTFAEYSSAIDPESFQSTLDGFVELGILEADPEPTYEEMVSAPSS
jgi:NitT/TauT family transport system substrate-binding protein